MFTYTMQRLWDDGHISGCFRGAVFNKRETAWSMALGWAEGKSFSPYRLKSTSRSLDMEVKTFKSEDDILILSVFSVEKERSM